MDPGVVDLSRLQFALTALYHFLFVPLTLGLSFMLVIMETVYVMTGRPIWREITRFWGKLFGINFVLGVATGLTMEFQFGTNWSYYSHYVGDIFGAPLAIEGLMAFFLEATFVGLLFFGWERLSKVGHLAVTFLVALGTNLSALWILIANGWMQNPVGAAFNPETMRMEVTDFIAVLFNPVAQAKFVHTVSAGYVLAAVVRARRLGLVPAAAAAYRRMRQALDDGRRRASAWPRRCRCVVLGDESGYTLTDNQKMKLAAIEATWQTEPAPAGSPLFGIPDFAARETHFAIKMPWVLGLIAHALARRRGDRHHRARAPRRGRASARHRRLRRGRAAEGGDRDDVEGARRRSRSHRQRPRLCAAAQARTSTIRARRRRSRSRRPPGTRCRTCRCCSGAFRVMAGIGFCSSRCSRSPSAVLACACTTRTRWFCKLARRGLPLPWIAIELGWVVAEIGPPAMGDRGRAADLPRRLVDSARDVAVITLVGFTAALRRAGRDRGAPDARGDRARADRPSRRAAAARPAACRRRRLAA